MSMSWIETKNTVHPQRKELRAKFQGLTGIDQKTSWNAVYRAWHERSNLPREWGRWDQTHMDKVAEYCRSMSKKLDNPALIEIAKVLFAKERLFEEET